MAPPPKKLRSRIGNPVRGEEFWPRSDVVDGLFSDLIDDKGSRRLFALRRIGKTSVLLELERRLLEQEDLTVVRIDVQGVNRFGDFLSKVFEQAPAETRMQQARKKIAANPVFKSILPALWVRLSGQRDEKRHPTSGTNSTTPPTGPATSRSRSMRSGRWS